MRISRSQARGGLYPRSGANHITDHWRPGTPHTVLLFMDTVSDFLVLTPLLAVVAVPMTISRAEGM